MLGSLSPWERARVRAGKADDGAAGLSLVRKRIPIKTGGLGNPSGFVLDPLFRRSMLRPYGRDPVTCRHFYASLSLSCDDSWYLWDWCGLKKGSVYQ